MPLGLFLVSPCHLLVALSALFPGDPAVLPRQAGHAADLLRGGRLVSLSHAALWLLQVPRAHTGGDAAHSTMVPRKSLILSCYFLVSKILS